MLIIGALVSLCVSDSVGPRLLPLPSEQRTTIQTEAPHGTEAAASRTPARTKGAGPKVEMAAAPQKRAGAGHDHMPASTNAQANESRSPASVGLRVAAADGPSLPLSAPVTRPPGRAPPRPA